MANGVAELERARDSYASQAWSDAYETFFGRRSIGWVGSRGSGAARHLRLHARARGRVPDLPRARKRTMRQVIKTATEHVPEPALAHIAISTAFVWGRHDRMVPVGLAEAASTRLGWQLHVVDEAAHVPHTEQPEGFLRALGAALEMGVHDHAT